MTPNYDDILVLLSAIGDPIRQQILLSLRGDRLNVGEITERLQATRTISRPAISHHLKVLKDAGVVTSEKAGQEVFYQVQKGVIIDQLREFADHLEQYFQEDETG